MSQITVLNQKRQVVDAYIVSEDLYQRLDSMATTSSLEFFGKELLEEFKIKFLKSVIVNSDLRDRDRGHV